MKKQLPALAAMLLAVTASCDRIPVFNLENPVAKAYLDQTHYPDDDYSFTCIRPYAEMETSFRKDQPSPVTLSWTTGTRLDSVVAVISERKDMKDIFTIAESQGATEAIEVWNLVPGKKYYYSIKGHAADGDWSELQKGAFRTEGRRRMLCVDGVNNVRDLGGLKTIDGKTIKFGKIYRGGQMDGLYVDDLPESGRKVMRELMKVECDIDYRGDIELRLTDDDPDNDISSSPLGPDVEYSDFQTTGIDGIHVIKEYGTVYRKFLEALREGKAIYNHCVAGADRTGVMCLLIEASLGVSEEDVIKDYELTSFSVFGVRSRESDKWKVPQGIDYIKSLEGETFQDKCRTLLKNQGVTEEEIEEFKTLMLD